MENGRLLRRIDLEDSDGDWRGQAANALETRLVDERYPCYFASSAWRDERLGVGFIESGDVEGAVHILREFAVMAASTESPKIGVIVIEEPHIGLVHADYFNLFWEYLRNIHLADRHGWPSDREKDPDSPEWMFMFENISYFVLGMAPSYPHSSSRNLASLAIVFIPRFAFDGIERGTEAGNTCREMIAQRLLAYDGIAVAQALDQTRDDAVAWRAYFVGCEKDRDACPFKVAHVSHRGRHFVSR